MREEETANTSLWGYFVPEEEKNKIYKVLEWKWLAGVLQTESICSINCISLLCYNYLENAMKCHL